MRILITGATGMIGSELVRQLHEKDKSINYLTTSRDKIQKSDKYHGYYWNPEEGEIDPACLQGVGTIIHLAGMGIFRRWTKKNKREIVDSRIKGAELLFRTLKEREHNVSHFVSASGISIYPSSYNKLYFEEEEKCAHSFLGELTVQWEAAADRFKDLDIRVAKVRTGIVLSEEEGALPQMQRPIRLGMGAPLGSGKQWQSWIHLKDVAGIYRHVVKNGLQGVYNATAPDPVTNKELTEIIAKVEGKKIRLPKVPGFAMKLVMGEMANLALESQLVASRKIQESGYNFDYVNLGNALNDLKGRNFPN